MAKVESDGLGRWEFFFQFLIVVSLFDFALETLPGLSEKQQYFLHCIEAFTVVAFTIEYVCRLWRSRPRGKYFWSFFGIVDLVAILPFYLSMGLDLRYMRIFRLLRLFRLFKLVRYSSATQRYHRAFLIAREELVLFGGAAMIMFFLASVGIYYFENEAQPQVFSSVFHSFWWAISTLTTVGYGDVYPVTVGGKIFTFLVLMVGLGFVAVPTGLVASALSKAREECDED